jgi:DeoR family transcriptional regulator of aga operon
VAFARICALDLVDELITDTAADPEMLRAIEDAGVAVTVV